MIRKYQASSSDVVLVGIWPTDFNAKSPASCSPKPNSATGVKQKLSQAAFIVLFQRLLIFRRENFQTKYCRGNAVLYIQRFNPHHLICYFYRLTGQRASGPVRRVLALDWAFIALCWVPLDLTLTPYASLVEIEIHGISGIRFGPSHRRFARAL